MGKGILMEVEGRRGVVLTPKGEFKRVPLPKGALEIGDEIEFKESAGLRLNWLAAAVAVLFMAVSPFIYQQWALAQPAALVQIDINPSIQLTLNGRQRVITAEGLNADGETVLQGLDLARRSVEEATREITARAVALGKLDPFAETSAVVVAVAPAGREELNEQAASEIAARSKVAVQAEVRHQAEAKGQVPLTQVAAVEATREEVRQAKEQGLTLPKLIILQEVLESHPEVTPESIANQGPGKFVQSLGLEPSEFFSKIEKKHKKGPETTPASTKEREEERGKGKPDMTGKPETPDRADDRGSGRASEKAGEAERRATGPERRDDSRGKVDDSRGKGDDSQGKGDDFRGKVDDSWGKGDDSRGKGDDSRGKGDDSRGKEDDSRGKKPDDASEDERTERAEKGFLESVKERLGIGSSDDKKSRESGKGDSDQEAGRSNRRQGGQEKGDAKANEGKGRNKP